MRVLRITGFGEMWLGGYGRSVSAVSPGVVAGAQRVEFPNAAHWLNVEYPDQFNQPVLEFLAAHPL